MMIAPRQNHLLVSYSMYFLTLLCPIKSFFNCEVAKINAENRIFD